jgi:hypothetical protein
MSDYVYRNANDTVRVRLFVRDRGGWDYDVFLRDGTIYTFTAEYGAGTFDRKRDALAHAADTIGALRSIAPRGH